MSLNSIEHNLHNKIIQKRKVKRRNILCGQQLLQMSWHCLGLALLVSLSLLFCSVTASKSPHGDWEDEDTLVIQADNSLLDHVAPNGRRVSRQTTYEMPPTTGINQPMSVQKGDSCMTPKGEAGVCTPLKQCYPFMYRHDLMNDGMYTGNVELARSIRDTAGSCVEIPDVVPDVVYQKFPFGIRTIQPDLICCTGNYTEIDVPPSPLVLITGNGQPASKGQFPSMVAIMNNGRQFCGGTVLDQTHVLTAAHCVAHMGGGELGRLTLQIGDHDIYSTRDGTHQTKRVLRLSKHRYFNRRTLHNDIAILTLKSSVTYNSYVSATSPSSSSGSHGTVCGWGRLYDGGPFPQVPYFVGVNIVPNASCKQKYGSLAPGGITDSMLCAGSSAGDACAGDSGGPLFVGGAQIGIVSWGIGCGQYPGVYTRVSSFLPWIQKNRGH